MVTRRGGGEEEEEEEGAESRGGGGGGSGHAGERRPRGNRGVGEAHGARALGGWRRPVHYATTRLYPPPGTTGRPGSLLHRKTGAKYNREPPWLMSRPNKAKNRPLNNARCNVGAAWSLLDMHGDPPFPGNSTSSHVHLALCTTPANIYREIARGKSVCSSLGMAASF